MDEQSSSIKVIIRGQEVAETIFDSGSGVNVINKTTYDKIRITKWDTNTVRPLGLIRKLDVILGGHTFQISTMVLHLDAPGVYPLLLGLTWLKTEILNKIGIRMC